MERGELYKPIFLLLLFFKPYCVVSQKLSSTKVWNEFFEIVTLTPVEQIKRFQILETFCHSRGITKDSVYTNLQALYASALYYSGDTYSATKRLSKAVEISEKYRDLNPPHYLSKYYFYLANYGSDSISYAQTISYYRKSIDYGSKGVDKWGIPGQACLFLSFLYKEIRDYEMSLEAATLGCRLSLARGDTVAWLNNLNEKVESLFYVGKRQETVLESATLLRYARDYASDSDLGRYFKIQGDILTELKRYSEAKPFYQQAVSYFRKSQEFNNLGIIYVDLHFLSLQGNEHSLRQRYFADAQKYLTNKYQLSRLFYNESTRFSKTGDYLSALLFIQKSLYGLPQSNVSLNKIEQNPQSKWAIAMIRKDYIFDPIQDKADTWLAYAKYTSNDRPKLQNALKTYMLADTMIDYMRWEHTGSVSKLYWRDKTRAMYERAIETCYLLNDPAKAFYFFEKSRAVMLNDQLNELGANQLLSVKDQEKERKLKQEVSSLQDKLSENENDEKVAAEIRTKLFRAQEERESFVSQIEKSSPQYYAYKYDNRVPDIAELRSKVLHDNQTFVSYFVGDSALYGLAISNKNIFFKKLKLPDYLLYNTQFQNLIGNRNLQNRAFGDYLRVSNQLYNILLKPFAIPANSRVIVSPDGSFLPFEALSFSATAPEYLVKKYAFSYSYSAGYLVKSRRSGSRNFSTKSFLGLSPVEYSSRLSQASLPGSDQALGEINDHFLFSQTLIGNEASKSAFVKNSPDYRIVQLFTHATADSTGAIPTLYFADTTLKLNELAPSAKSATELLVLSACRTGVGKNQRGEGVFSLARGFAGIGIPSTVTTLWSVENEPIYALTKLFYTELGKELPLDIALQNAQNEWLKTASPDDQLPYAWAGMVLVGNADPVDMGIRRMLGYTIAGTLIVIVIFLIFYLRGRNKRLKNKVFSY
jgi:CHAT domain-containing protein